MPLEHATLTEGRIVVPYRKDQVKNAPRIEPDDELSPAGKEELFGYYGLSSSTGQQSQQQAGIGQYIGTQTDVRDRDRGRATNTRTGADDAMPARRRG